MSRKIIKHINHIIGTITYRDIYGNIHREDGPAVIQIDGTEHWWYNNKYLSNVHSAEELIIKNIID